MLTSIVQAERVRDDRPAYRPYRAEVVRIVPIGRSFRRVTFSGADFGDFGTAGLDQRIKIVLPHPNGGYGDAGWDDAETLGRGDWYQRWRALPDAERNPFRTYTVRAVRPRERELDVDFVVHCDDHAQPGPAAAWLERAAPGDEVVIVGPDDRSVGHRVGLDWHPGDAVEYLLAGDETAAPAICSILESLPAGSRAQAFIEVPHRADAREVSSAADIRLTWLPRDRAHLPLEEAVRRWVDQHRDAIAPALSPTRQELADIDVDTDMLWDSPDESTGRFYAWLAGESAVIKTLRRLLVTEVGVDRRRVAFMGYWRLGKAESQ